MSCAELSLSTRDAQSDMLIEEMSELTKAILKHRRNQTQQTLESIREEMADVQIVLDQLYLIYGTCDKYRREKLLRLAVMLGMYTDEDTEGGRLE